MAKSSGVRRATEEASARVESVETALAVLAHEGVNCFLGKEAGSCEQPSELTSGIGGSFWGKEAESWPTTAKGQPLLPWLTVRCDELPHASGAFYEKQALAFYLDPAFDGWEAVSSTDQCFFAVRTYWPSDKLVQLSRPQSLEGHPWIGLRWQEEKDYPSLSKFHGLFSDETYSALSERERLAFENLPGVKIGGWPTPVQGSQGYPGSCDLQIDVTTNFMYADSGVAYLSQSGSDWHVVFETC